MLRQTGEKQKSNIKVELGKKAQFCMRFLLLFKKKKIQKLTCEISLNRKQLGYVWIADEFLLWMYRVVCPCIGNKIEKQHHERNIQKKRNGQSTLYRTVLF